MTAVDPTPTALQRECAASLAKIRSAQDRPLTFEESDALAMRIERLYAKVAALEATTTSEWGVRLVSGGWTNPKRSHEAAVGDIRGLRAHDQAAVLVTRTVSYGAWTEVPS